MKRSCATALLAGLAIAGCSDGAPPTNNAVEQAASALTPGEYEVATTVDSLRSTDKTTPATKLKQGATPEAARTCVGPDNAIDFAAFAEAGESCEASETYTSNGRLSLQLRCNRPGKGSITHTVDGDFKAESFDAKVMSGSFFSGTGDYEMTRSLSAKRIGDCTPKAA